MRGIISSTASSAVVSRQLGFASKRSRRMLPVRITLTITDGTLKGEEYVFHDAARFVLGRSPDCDIALPMDLIHRDVSRYHCAFEFDPPMIRVRDLGSLNGTYVNGEKIGQRSIGLAPDELDLEGVRNLRDGDMVRVGNNMIRVNVEVLGLVPMRSA